ncbi:hypothetical protein LB518_09355 [Mesorhizobium sp. BR1-1-16]|uniref:di-heme oxidoredictase family protein n=1 Tax=Mesorhizobium sp. BR1-1-16 TaxID=2876653 RepID=UPI001CCE16C1|nr:di-heme oxidoredictase family protein [Mesorhizobium sp. BR1-1-16]MBZ9936500.1 hypothetical protein [Mesorhizobium sp. BR1-1-16]
MRRGRLLLAALLVLPGFALADGLERAMGKALFDRQWVAAPSSTLANDGLGPLFTEKGCITCHTGKAFSARLQAAPDGTVTAHGLTTRLGNADGRPDPVYGRQIQPRSVPGLESEGTVTYRAHEGLPMAVSFAPAFGALAPGTRLGPRLAPPLAGIGRIALVDETAILAREDPDDRNGDGISGHARRLADGSIGRYGWKASAATLDQQVADAFMLDIGMSSPLSPHPSGDCTAAEAACRAAPDGRDASFDGEEVSQQMVGLITAYLDGLAAPTPPATDDPALALFAATGCAACHVPSLPRTGGGTVALYSDLLLHDMGPDLDDGVGEPGVRSSEWRTAPLIALALRRDTETRYLHDGRAATVDAAIRAHGGEASRARANYGALSADDRMRLLSFLDRL